VPSAWLASFPLSAVEPCLSVPLQRGHQDVGSERQTEMASWFQAGFTQWWLKMAGASPSAGWVMQDRIADMIEEAPWWRLFTG